MIGKNIIQEKLLTFAKAKVQVDDFLAMFVMMGHEKLVPFVRAQAKGSR